MSVLRVGLRLVCLALAVTTPASFARAVVPPLTMSIAKYRGAVGEAIDVSGPVCSDGTAPRVTSSGLIENPPFPPPVTNLVVMTVSGVWHADATWQSSPTLLTAACIADATFVSKVVAPTSFGAGSVSATAISPLYAEIVVPNVIQGSHFVAVTGGAAEQVIGETTATSNTLSMRVPLGSGEVWILGQGLWLSEFPAPMEWVTVVPDGPGESHVDPAYRGVVPARVLESRVGSGLSTVDGLFVGSGGVGPDASRVVQISGRAGIPVGFVGTVALNVTVTNASEASYLTVYPAGAVVPETSNLNFVAGQTVPNMVLVPTSSDGRVALYNRFGSVDTIVDVLGYFPGNQLVALGTNDATYALSGDGPG